MSDDWFRRSLRDFAGTLIDANQVLGSLTRNSYRSYGPVFDYPGVAEIVNRSTVRELCELAARVENRRAKTVQAERPSVVCAFVRKAFTVRLHATRLSVAAFDAYDAIAVGDPR
jgi:hypothetical protein